MANGMMEAGLSPDRATLIGGVGYRWQGDLSFGLAVFDLLASRKLPPHVTVADLGYGAIYAAQDIADMHPPVEQLVLVAGTVRDRKPGEWYAFRWDGAAPDADRVQALIREAGAGVVHVDHLLAVGVFLKALPPDVFVVEVEPNAHLQGETLSSRVAPLVHCTADVLFERLTVVDPVPTSSSHQP